MSNKECEYKSRGCAYNCPIKDCEENNGNTHKETTKEKEDKQRTSRG